MPKKDKKSSAEPLADGFTANGGLVIGCKLPHGLILEVDGTKVELNGTNSANIIGGYGFTENVDPSFMNEWVNRHRQHPAVINGLIFAQETTVEARAQAEDNAENRNGFEGIDPAKPAPGIEPVAPPKA